MAGKIIIDISDKGERTVTFEGDVDPGNIQSLMLAVKLGYYSYISKRAEAERANIDVLKVQAEEKRRAEALAKEELEKEVYKEKDRKARAHELYVAKRQAQVLRMNRIQELLKVIKKEEEKKENLQLLEESKVELKKLQSECRKEGDK